jgi:hypothetical protein
MSVEPEDIFSNIIILAIGVVMIGVVLGYDVSGLLNVLPNIIVLALILALTVGVLRAAVD